MCVLLVVMSIVYNEFLHIFEMLIFELVFAQFKRVLYDVN